MTASSLNSALGCAALPAVATPDEALEAGLVEAAQGGCPDAFRSLVERHQQRIYHFCFHYLRHACEAREACQDTFIRAHRALGSYRPRARFSTWLFRIALNLCRDRARRRRVPTEAIDPELPCPRGAPDDSAMRDADLAKLDRGLAALPEKFRAVIVLSCLDGLSHAECAAVLKCSERSVEGRLYRARRKLAAWWEE
ncbi:RNA polymerase sigma factor [Luteolibacter marinus]|uniref:RNA polymerase sigma factor n=1 Tax=Luteolibacter marinus TaxID=2776705 RepID=UPI00186940E2|nr:RNA polymerase sigma factor [Luteolibacter marinus]